MIAASLYIIACTAKNRIRVRLRRLREPRYIVGAIVGAAYLYFTVFLRMRGGRPRSSVRRGRPLPAVSLEAYRVFGPPAVGMALLGLTALGWLFPSDSTLLEFSESEVQFLFPAPVTRRALLLHRLMRSQLGLLFAAIVSGFFVPSASPGTRARFAVSMWVILATIKVHFTGITLARTSLVIGRAGSRRRQWGVLAVTLGAVAIVAGAIARAFLTQPVTGLDEALGRLGTVLTTGLSHLVLLPFTMLALPLFSPWPGPYLAGLAAASAVLLVNVAWVLRSDEALQEAVANAEARRAAQKGRERHMPRAREARWTLALSGRPEMIFVWKSAMQTLRETTATTVIRYGAPFIVLSLSISSAYLGGTRMRATAAILGTLAATIAAIVVVVGPQLVRTDLRQDLLHLELLKTWPLGSAAVIRGEMLWPGALLTTVAWVAILCALVWWTPAFSVASLPFRVAAATAAAIAAPALVFAQLTIHNAAALLFPAWVSLGSSRPRGLDAMGQRLVLFAGVMLGLILMLAPAGTAAGIVWFAFYRLIGSPVLPAAAAVFTVIVLLEVLLATEALGPAYERLDVMAVERAE